jgi:hypothetical protein
MFLSICILYIIGTGKFVLHRDASKRMYMQIEQVKKRSEFLPKHDIKSRFLFKSARIA